MDSRSQALKGEGVQNCTVAHAYDPEELTTASGYAADKQ